MFSLDTETWERRNMRGIGSSEWRSAKQQPQLNLCGLCCTQWQGFPPASLSSVRGAKCVTRGAPNLWTLTLIQTQPRCLQADPADRYRRSQVCVSEQDPTCSPFLLLTRSPSRTALYDIFSSTETTHCDSAAGPHTKRHWRRPDHQQAESN